MCPVALVVIVLVVIALVVIALVVIALVCCVEVWCTASWVCGTAGCVVLLGVWYSWVCGTAGCVVQLGVCGFTNLPCLPPPQYSGPLIAVLLYLHSQGVEADMACVLVVMGSIIHMWGLVILGPLGGPGLGWWTAVMGALPRYAGMFLLAIALQKCTAKDIGQFSAANIARYDRVGVPGA